MPNAWACWSRRATSAAVSRRCVLASPSSPTSCVPCVPSSSMTWSRSATAVCSWRFSRCTDHAHHPARAALRSRSAAAIRTAGRRRRFVVTAAGADASVPSRNRCKRFLTDSSSWSQFSPTGCQRPSRGGADHRTTPVAVSASRSPGSENPTLKSSPARCASRTSNPIPCSLRDVIRPSRGMRSSEEQYCVRHRWASLTAARRSSITPGPPAAPSR